MKEKLGLRSGQAKKVIHLPYRIVKEKSNLAMFLTCIACCVCLLSPGVEISKRGNLSHSLKKREVNNFGSRTTFSDQRFSHDLQKLLSSPMVQAELDEKINNGQLCAYWNSKVRVFKVEEDEIQTPDLILNSTGCPSDNIWSNGTNHIHQDIFQFARLYNQSNNDMLKGKEKSKQANSFKFDRRILKEKQEKIKKQQKINKLISNVISEQSQMDTGNGTIFFYSSMTNQFDDMDSQFLKVPTNS